jgi:hypothetical protein
MPSDLVFNMCVHVSRSEAMPRVLQSVHQAIDWIDSLPEQTQRKPHWRAALNDLFDADEVRDRSFLNRARSTLVQALREERWLAR